MPLVYQSARHKPADARQCTCKGNTAIGHRLVTIVRGLVFGGAIEFQQGVDLDFLDFIAAEFAFDGSDGVLSTDR